MEKKIQEKTRDYYIALALQWTPGSKPQIDDSWPTDVRNLAYDVFFEKFRYQPIKKNIDKTNVIFFLNFVQ